MAAGSGEGAAAEAAAGSSNYDIVILLARAEERVVAAVGRTDDVVSLPRVAVEGEPDTSSIVAAIARLLGEPCPPPLRIVPLGVIGARPGLALVEVQPLSDSLVAAPSLPNPLTWRALTPRVIESTEPELARPYLDRWLAELAGTLSGPARPPWSQPGWLTRASAWMADRLAENGSPLVAAPRIHALWGLSAVVRGETADGSAFLKGCSPIFPTESVITQILAASDPDLLPSVVAVDRSENWLLMRDLGQSFVGDAPVVRWPEGLVAHAAIQRRWLDRADDLAMSGFERRGLAELAWQIRELPALPLLAALEAGARRRLEAAVPRLVEACDRLTAIGPAETIVHGDLHPWNVADADGRSIVFDWSDSCIGHPFLDLATYVGRTRDVSTRRACVDAYLAAWSDVMEPEMLEEAVRLALPLSALHQVESYRRVLEGLAEDDWWDMAEAGPGYAEQALGWLDEGLAAEIQVHD